MKLWEVILVLLAVWNLVVFITYAIDKKRAIRRQWRVPESVLLTMTFAAGGLGALLGMLLVRHKTRQIKFQILVPLALTIQIIVAVLLMI